MSILVSKHIKMYNVGMSSVCIIRGGRVCFDLNCLSEVFEWEQANILSTVVVICMLQQSSVH